MSTPEIKVVKGNPTEDELAALRTVLAQMSAKHSGATGERLSLIHISEPTRPVCSSRMPSSA